MKRLIILCLLLSGCFVRFGNHSVNADIFIEPGFMLVSTEGEISAITIKLVNRKFIKVNIEIGCYFSDDILFADKIVEMDERSEKNFVLYGFMNWENIKPINCRILNIY